jgi:dUTP pyrophosphatase
VEIKFSKIAPRSQVPTRAHASDAGYDLYSRKFLRINPMERALVPTGIRIAIPRGYYGRIAPRSGLALKHGIDVMAGVIDSGYRNELAVVLINLIVPQFVTPLDVTFGSQCAFEIKPGDRIAQLIIEKCYKVEWKETDALDVTNRGIAGFGESGS